MKSSLSWSTLMRTFWFLTATLAGLGACATPSPPAAPTLRGTAWQLHAIQSMDDAQGTTRIADPSRFTLRLQADGSAAMQLDCNRGTATWEAAPAGDGTGSLKFGPVAATRALCPPPPISERVVRDLGFVRGYRLMDGKLFMSLMADGGIYEWRPLRD
jgi:heat shock protein HslJ